MTVSGSPRRAGRPRLVSENKIQVVLHAESAVAEKRLELTELVHKKDIPADAQDLVEDVAQEIERPQPLSEAIDEATAELRL